MIKKAIKKSKFINNKRNNFYKSKIIINIIDNNISLLKESGAKISKESLTLKFN